MSVGYLDQAFPAHRRGKNRARQLNAPEQNLYLWILQQFAGGEPPSAADTKERATQNGLDFSAAAASLRDTSPAASATPTGTSSGYGGY